VLWVFKCFEVEVELVVPTIDVQGLLKLECVSKTKVGWKKKQRNASSVLITSQKQRGVT
jgi:hypothetical protein